MPKQRFISWSLPPDIAPQGTVLEIVNAIKTFGMPFIDVHSEPAVFRETLEGGKYTILNQDEYLPALYIVEGEFDLAATVLNEAVCRRGDRFDPEARWYRNFALKLEAIMAT